MRRFSYSIEGIIALVLFLLLTSCFPQERKIVGKTILKVNDTEVSTKEFAERLALKIKDYDALGAKDEVNLKRAKEETVQALVLEVITRDYAKRNNLKVTNKEIEEEITATRAKYPDDLSFRRAFAQENLSFEKWRERVSFTLLQKKVFIQVTSTTTEPDEVEIKKYYEKNKSSFRQEARIRLRQIVLSKEDDAKLIVERLQKGGKFADLAKQYSIAPEGQEGGDTGWIEKGTLDVFDAAFNMSVGSRSKIVKSPYGYHIFEVIKKEQRGYLSFPEAKARIRALMKERQEQEAFSNWLEEETRKSSVLRNDDLISAIKVTTRGT